MNNDDQLRYPIGKFSAQESYSIEEVKTFIQRISEVPARIQSLAKSLTPQQLDLPYRDGGWTGRQVLHHIADSHMNAYIRIKWTLTEETPTIKAYDEKKWATTPETTGDIDLSLNLLIALHQKWVTLLSAIQPEDFRKQFYHPDSKKHVRIDQAIATYAWHGEHHLGHLKMIAAK